MSGSDLSLKPQAAREAAQAKERVALGSIAASALITLAKGTAGLATGSLALISDAAHSLLDVAATTMTWFAVRAANKPADEEHHYGHGKFESLAALIETAFLFLLSGAVALEGVQRLLTGESTVQASWAAAGVLVGAIVVDAWRWRQLKRVAAETGSEALEADALHFSSDLVNSVLVLAALGVAAAGYPQVDSVVAVGVAIFTAVAEDLPDAELTITADPVQLDDESIMERVMLTAARLRLPVHHITVQNLEGQLAVSFDVEVDGAMTLARAHEVADRLEAAIQEELGPQVEVESHIEPLAIGHLEGREADAATVARIASTLAASTAEGAIREVHSVRVRETPAGLVVNYHCRVEPNLNVAAVHELVDDLERRVRLEHSEILRVVGHAEPLGAA